MLDFYHTPFAVTLERPWKFNQPELSCIPEGAYLCKRVDVPTFGETFEITDVPNRTKILFHWGNLVKNTLGCILLGEQFELLLGEPAIMRSKKAFNEFMNKLEPYEEFVLEIYR